MDALTSHALPGCITYGASYPVISIHFRHLRRNTLLPNVISNDLCCEALIGEPIVLLLGPLDQLVSVVESDIGPVK